MNGDTPAEVVVDKQLLTVDIIRRWLSYISRNFSENTHAQYKSIIWQFYDFAPKYICNLTLEHLEAYMASLNGLASKTINCHIIVLKSFGHWLEDRNLPNPSKKLRKIPEHSQQRILSEQEYEKVLAVCNSKEADVIRFLANTGLRANEFVSLKPSDITADQKFLYILGKANKGRVVPLNDTCRQIIKRHPNIKLSKNYRHLNRICHCLSIHAGIPLFTPHALRHYCATQLMRKGVSIYKISKMLGHSSVKITEKCYVHFLAKIDLMGVTDCL